MESFRWLSYVDTRRIFYSVALLLILVVCNILIGFYSEYTNIYSLLPDCTDTALLKWMYRTNLTCQSETGSALFPISPQAVGRSASLSTPLNRIVSLILWNDTLSFNNYLCILSVSYFLNPYLIILYTKKSFKLRPSQFDYNDWGEKIVSRLPMIQIENLDLLDKKKYSPANDHDAVISVMNKTGGIYIRLDALVNKDLWKFENLNIRQNKNKTGPLGFSYQTETTNFIDNCVSEDKFTGSEMCCTIQRKLVPASIMWEISPFASLCRTLFYGKPDISRPTTSFPPIPKIVHYVWFGDEDIHYSMFLSFLSTQRFVKPSKIYIYVNTNKRASSVNFDKVTSFSNVQIVFYGPLHSVYQNHIASPDHASDIIRADVLLRHGGIYIDFDVFWTKPIDDVLSRGYETIAALDWSKDMYPRQDFPATINMGVVLARPGSRFIALWKDSYRKYRGHRHYTYHAVEQVYRIYEEHPDLLIIDVRLQIPCFKLKCHALWLDTYTNVSANDKFDFRNDVYSVHFTYPTPEAFKSEEAVRKTKGFYGDMARHISGIK